MRHKVVVVKVTHMQEPSAMNSMTIGLDHAKSVFQVHGVDGAVHPIKLTAAHSKRGLDPTSGGGNLQPSSERPRPEFAKGAAGDQVALDIEVVVDGGMGGKESLRRAR